MTALPVFAPGASPAAERDGLFVADDGLARCRWCRATSVYRHYHDHEWGFPVTDDRRLADSGIVRHRGKIASTINNAHRVIDLRREFGSLAAHAWGFEPDASARPGRVTAQALAMPATSTASIVLSKDLKKRGWTFVGPTTVYTFMQAMGLVNDHIEGCATRERALQARRELRVPMPS